HRCRRLRSGWRTHAIQRLLVRDDLGTGDGAGTPSRNAATRYRRARRADLLISTDVIGVRVRVDDVANGPVGQLTHRRQPGIRILLRTGVDEDRTKVADLDCDIRSGADDDVDVALNRHRVQTAFTARRRHRRTALRAAVNVRRQRSDDDGSGEDKNLFQHRQPQRRAGGAGMGIVLTLSMYCGYIVSAPPRVGGTGSPCSAANSVRNGFLPGRWWGTYAGSRPGTSSSA